MWRRNEAMHNKAVGSRTGKCQPLNKLSSLLCLHLSLATPGRDEAPWERAVLPATQNTQRPTALASSRNGSSTLLLLRPCLRIIVRFIKVQITGTFS